MRATRWIVVVALALAFHAVAAAADDDDWVYNLEPGDSVWKVSHRHLKDPSLWDKLRDLNSIEKPREMPVGSKLIIPREWLKERPLLASLASPSGDVFVDRDGDRRPASEGEIEPAASIIVETGDSGRVSVMLGDGSTVDLGPSSKLRFEELAAVGDGSMADIRVYLEAGSSVAFFPSNDPNPGRFQLWTKPAVTSVRGTAFRVAVEGQEERARAEVVKGDVAFAASGEVIEVPASFGSAAEDGKPPIPPRALLAAPDLSETPTVVERVPIRIDFGDVEGARAYRARLAYDERESSVFREEIVEESVLAGLELEDGRYILRVRAIDDIGLEGLEVMRPLEIDVRPLVPAPNDAGRQGKVRTGEEIRLNWAADDEARMFDVEVARTPQFGDTTIIERRTETNELLVEEELQPGLYAWRVSAGDGKGDMSPPSDASTLEIADPPLPVALQASEGGDGRLEVSWPAQLPEYVYRIEISKTADFATIDRIFESKGSSDSLPRPLPGTYWVRANAVDSDGYPGPYGEAIEITFGPRPFWAVWAIPSAILALALLL